MTSTTFYRLWKIEKGEPRSSFDVMRYNLDNTPPTFKSLCNSLPQVSCTQCLGHRRCFIGGGPAKITVSYTAALSAFNCKLKNKNNCVLHGVELMMVLLTETKSNQMMKIIEIACIFTLSLEMSDNWQQIFRWKAHSTMIRHAKSENNFWNRTSWAFI